jgi:hypothetical protein
MEYEDVAKRQFGWVRNDLIGVVDSRIEGNAPGLVPDNPFAVLACRLRIIAVAVIPEDRLVAVSHRYPLAFLHELPRSLDNSLRLFPGRLNGTSILPL